MLSPRGHSIRTAGLSLLFVVKDVLHVLTVIRKCTFVLFRSGHLGCHSNSAQQEDSKLHISYTQLAPPTLTNQDGSFPLHMGGWGTTSYPTPQKGHTYQVISQLRIADMTPEHSDLMSAELQMLKILFFEVYVYFVILFVR